MRTSIRVLASMLGLMVFGCITNPGDGGVQESDNADLAALAVSAGSLNPGFSSNDSVYTDTVPYAVAAVTITPTAADKGTSIRIRDASVVSNSASAPVSLSLGSNLVAVEVTAPNGKAKKTYTIDFVRRLPNYDGEWVGISKYGSGTTYDSIKTTLMISNNSITSFRIDYSQSNINCSSRGLGTSVFSKPSPLLDTGFTVKIFTSGLIVQFDGKMNTESDASGVLTFSAGCGLSFKAWNMTRSMPH